MIESWPEVFEDVEIKAVPVEYVTSVTVKFNDGTVWEVELDTDKIHENGGNVADVVEETLESFFDEYDEYIEAVDFRLDTDRVIKEIKERVEVFMKKHN